MASTLCCMAEQESRPGSPQLPNARVSQATPAKRPLLPKLPGSPNSRFTSARSEELHELRDIFDHAQDGFDDGASPIRVPRARFSRPSMHSLRTLHSMASLRSIIRRKFSKDSANNDLAAPQTRSKAKKKTITQEPDTVVKQVKQGPNQQLKITKDDLRKDLLSDKKPHEGGYDSDAEVLDDIARNIGKKTSGKRPSIHSIDWTSSTPSKPTPGSSTKGRDSAELKRYVPPYHIEKSQTVSFTTRFNQVFSTPNLRADTSGEWERKLRRSHSATSMVLPKPSPISPLRLPSLSACDKDGVPWSEVMNQSLRLSQFPVPPRRISPNASKTKACIHQSERGGGQHTVSLNNPTVSAPQPPEAPAATSATRAIEIRVQQPTSSTTPRASTSVRGHLGENASPRKDQRFDDVDDDERGENPRSSVHLYSMRISHHLRSGSLLSWDQLADAPELPTPPRAFRERTVSDQSRRSRVQRQSARHERQTSSSGFASSKIPSRWGKVLANDHDLRPDVASSIYSSRPQSPPGSSGGSAVNLTRTMTAQHTFSITSIDMKKPRRSQSCPTDSEDTPRAIRRHGVMPVFPPEPTREDVSSAAPGLLARKNSVADTKTSKFREEFSPSPPKRRLTPSASIIKFLNPKRLSMRSQSEVNLQFDSTALAMDGPSDTLAVPVDRERRQSRSLMSLQAEQDALGKNKGANHVWDRALQAHQEEKASLFLPKNRDQARHASPFRDHSGSIAPRRASLDEDLTPATQASSQAGQLSAPLIDPFAADQYGAHLPTSRRSALAVADDVTTARDVSIAFDKQGDGTEIVGAWGRYPSHTRHDRTFSAGKVDRVEARDFALEAAIKFASNANHNHDDELIDPAERLPSPPLLPGQKKKKKKAGSGRMAKSNSMTFGKTLMKNYTKMFKSQSTEFQRHGRGHRSSIASGGILEFPELELVPSVWTGNDHAGIRTDTREYNQLDGQVTGRVKLPVEDSMATLRPRRNSSAPNLTELSFRDGANESEHERDRARVWSVYYENCVPSFPRLSTDGGFGLEDFGGPSRLSLDSKRVSIHSHTMPTRSTKHSRNASQLSRMRARSRGSARPSFASSGHDDIAADERSVVSVRRSTMDLISRFKQQEATEHAALTGKQEMEAIEAL